MGAGGRGAAREARALFAALWESWHAASRPGAGRPGIPTRRPCAPGRSAGSTARWSEGSPVEGAFRAELAAHAGFLRRSLETDVGGNHLIKNLKALAGLAVFFADDALLARALRRLRRQLAVQVLPDGGHYERAPAYHCQVLGDLIDIAGLLRAAGPASRPGCPTRSSAMRGWLGAGADPAGDVPLLNDGFPVSPRAAGGAAPAAPPAGPLHVLPDTGLARVAVGGWHVLADIGPPCPRELPAHAHADTLSCLVHVDGEPLLIDTGTSTYARRGGPRPRAVHGRAQHRWKWTAATPPRCGGRSGPAAGPGCGRVSAHADGGHGDGRGRPRRLPEPARTAAAPPPVVAARG